MTTLRSSVNTTPQQRRILTLNPQDEQRYETQNREYKDFVHNLIRDDFFPFQADGARLDNLKNLIGFHGGYSQQRSNRTDFSSRETVSILSLPGLSFPAVKTQPRNARAIAVVTHTQMNFIENPTACGCCYSSSEETFFTVNVQLSLPSSSIPKLRQLFSYTYISTNNGNDYAEDDEELGYITKRVALEVDKELSDEFEIFCCGVNAEGQIGKVLRLLISLAPQRWGGYESSPDTVIFAITQSQTPLEPPQEAQTPTTTTTTTSSAAPTTPQPKPHIFLELDYAREISIENGFYREFLRQTTGGGEFFVKVRPLRPAPTCAFLFLTLLATVPQQYQPLPPGYPHEAPQPLPLL